MLDKKSFDHSATLPTRVVRDVAHVGIEARQLLFDGGFAGRILEHHAASFEHLEKMTQSRLQLMTQTTDRVGAGARRLVFRKRITAPWPIAFRSYLS